LGSNQRRLSRRFYRPLPPPESYATDLRLRVARRDSGAPPSAICPCASGSGGVPPGFLPLTWRFRMPARCRRLPLVAGAGPGVRGAEGVGNPPVGGIGLPVDAVGVDLEQDGDAVPGAAGDLGRGHPGVQPQRDGGASFCALGGSRWWTARSRTSVGQGLAGAVTLSRRKAVDGGHRNRSAARRRVHPSSAASAAAVCLRGAAVRWSGWCFTLVAGRAAT
jgi:hypothetical protein